MFGSVCLHLLIQGKWVNLGNLYCINTNVDYTIESQKSDGKETLKPYFEEHYISLPITQLMDEEKYF